MCDNHTFIRFGLPDSQSKLISAMKCKQFMEPSMHGSNADNKIQYIDTLYTYGARRALAFVFV